MAGTLLGASWQYHDNGSWHAFPPEGNEKMHQAYLTYLQHPVPRNRFVSICSAGVEREVDFLLMQQKRCDNNKILAAEMVVACCGSKGGRFHHAATG